MVSFFSTLALGIIAAVIAAYFQNRSWRYRNLEELRQREYKDAMQVVEHLGAAVDNRLIAQRRFLGLVNQKTAQHADYVEYSKALDSWMGQFSAFKTKIYLNFGNEDARTFENVVHKRLREASDIILRTYKFGEENLSKRDLKEHLTVGARLSSAAYYSTKFINALNSKISDYEFGTVQYINDINGGNIDLISRTYLVSRLFGMKS